MSKRVTEKGRIECAHGTGRIEERTAMMCFSQQGMTGPNARRHGYGEVNNRSLSSRQSTRSFISLLYNHASSWLLIIVGCRS